MDNVASVVSSALGKNISFAAGSGASGGMGACLMLLGAELHPRFDIIQKFLNIGTLFQDTDICITAEGGLDEQTPRGKIPAHVARIAKAKGIPVIALAGTVGIGARKNYEAGIDAYASILQGPSTLQMAIKNAESLLTDAAENAMRMVLVGQALSRVMIPAVLSGPEATGTPMEIESTKSALAEPQWSRADSIVDSMGEISC
jgi:glycerate kinase